MADSWEVVMPRLSDTMTEGVVSRWLKSVGDQVAKGDPLVEVDTEKATMEITAEADGFLVAILAAEGAEVPIGAAIGVIAEDAEHVPAAGSTAPAGATSSAPAPGEVDGQSSDAVRQGGGERERSAQVEQGSALGDPAPAGGDAGRVRASPIARKLAAKLGVDIRSLGTGRGPQGRILRSDVERAAARQAAVAKEAVPAGPQQGVREPSRLQAAIARRMVASKQTIPHFYVSVEVDATRLSRLREEIKATSEGASISLTTLVVKACARTLRNVPEVTVSWQDDRFVSSGRIDIGVAVALDDGGLVVPVIRDADRKTPSSIQDELRELARRARESRLTEADLSDGTFTVSNMGMFGIDCFFAIINPPQSGILAVGALRRALDLVDGEICVRQVLTLSLSGDHRVYSGATAARFLTHLREDLENPISLFLEGGS